MNGTGKELKHPMERYKEVLQGKNNGKDIITGRTISWGEEINLQPRAVLVMEI